MKSRLFIAAFFVVAAPFLWAKDDPVTQQLLDAALKQERFLDAGTAEYALDADVTAQVNGPVQGHFRFRWQSIDYWWSRIDLGTFQQIRIRNGEMEYTLRNADFIPLRVKDFYSMMGLEELDDQLKAEKEKKRADNGAELLCIEAKYPKYPNETHAICLDAVSHDLVSDTMQYQYVSSDSQTHTWEFQSDGIRIKNFSNYSDFNGQSVPHHIELLKDGKSIVSISNISLQLVSFDPALLEPPKGAIERRFCKNMKFPVALNHPDVDSKIHTKVDITAVLSITVLTDGSVGDVYMMQSGGSILDAAAVAAAKKYKFTPAMCGDQPVIRDIWYEVTHRAS